MLLVASCAVQSRRLALLPFLTLSLVLGACAGDGYEDPELGVAAGAIKRCADGEVVQGIDVSSWQPDIDWTKVADSGRRFAFIRVSDGMYQDKKFEQFWSASRSAGLIRSAYQYYEPEQDPIEQAELLLQKIGGKIEPGDLPPLLDVEAKGSDPAKVIAGMHTWLDHVEGAIGMKPIIYMGFYFWRDTLQSPTDFVDYHLMLPAYPYTAWPDVLKGCPNTPDPWPKWTFWQYSNGGLDITPGIPAVPGVGQSCDRDIFNGSLDELLLLTKGAGKKYAAKFEQQSWPLASQSPLSMVVGETQEGWIDLRNVGTQTWKPGVVYLASIPRDEPSDLYDASSWSSSTRVSTVTQEVPPGEVGRFVWNIHASKPGDTQPYFGLVAEGAGWFADDGGPADEVIQLSVHVAPEEPEPSEGEGGAAGAAGETGEAGESGSGGSAGESAGSAGQAGVGGESSSAGRSGNSGASGADSASPPPVSVIDASDDTMSDGGCSSSSRQPIRGAAAGLLALAGMLLGRQRRARAQHR